MSENQDVVSPPKENSEEEAVVVSPDEAEAEHVVVDSGNEAGDEKSDSVHEEAPTKSLFDLHFDMLLNELRNIIGTGEVTPINVLATTVSLMQVTEGYKDLKGHEKKELVLKVLQQFIEESDGDSAILALLPSFIDTAINLDKGEVTIKINTKGALNCCSGLVAALKRKK